MDTLIEQYHSRKITHSTFWGTIQHLIRDEVEVFRHLEAHGYCHQDIKPKNIRISSKELRAFVLDFSSLDKIGEHQHAGSEFYTSPEFYTSGGTSTISDKVDCYSIGQILYLSFTTPIDIFLKPVVKGLIRYSGILICHLFNTISKA